ncbi:enolase C-terminal domain-like protein [Chitinophagaceae bacterium 26-R-25]|nr:enolase C-terminal domain-like protein [Chitinophagaceae bacterium 26-R-25]
MNTIDNEVFKISSARIRTLEPSCAAPPFQDATMGPFHTFGIAILTLEDEDGVIGEAPVFSSYNNILENFILPILLHNQNQPYNKLYPQLYWSIRNEGFRGQASAVLGQIDLALHDLAARRHKLPLHKYLNAERNEVDFYGSGGGTNYSLKELEAELTCFLNAGTRCYKMKVGKDFGSRMKEDVERVKFVRRLMGKDVKLAVDANQIWTCEQALQFIDMTGGEDLAWFEEPVHSAALDQIEKLTRSTTIAISYGESERTSKTFPALVNMGVRHLQPVPTQIGGVREWMEVRDLAHQTGIQFTSGGYSWFTASLMASANQHCQVEYLYAIMHGLEKYFLVLPERKNGKFVLPSVEGSGAQVDWDLCARGNKIVSQKCWSRRDVRTFSPLVSI